MDAPAGEKNEDRLRCGRRVLKDDLAMTTAAMCVRHFRPQYLSTECMSDMLGYSEKPTSKGGLAAQTRLQLLLSSAPLQTPASTEGEATAAGRS